MVGLQLPHDSGSFRCMKHTKSILFVVALFSFSTVVLAADSTICTKDKLERRVAVVSTTNKAAPCEVRYYKDGESEGKVLWNAKNKIEYCNSKAQEFVKKLGSFGWSCKGTPANTAQAVTSTTTVETPTTPEDEKLKETKKKKKDSHRKNPKADTETPAEATAPAADVKKQ